MHLFSTATDVFFNTTSPDIVVFLMHTHGQAQMCSQNLRNKLRSTLSVILQHKYVSVHKVWATFAWKLSTDTPSQDKF